MIRVYTRIDGKLAAFDISNANIEQAIATVKTHTGNKAVLAVVK